MTLKKEWFDLIAQGKKKEEYREQKMYWITRLVDLEKKEFRHFDEIYFKNGYKKESPLIIVEWKGISTGLRVFEGEEKEVFIIKIGKILEIKGCEGTE